MLMRLTNLALPTALTPELPGTVQHRPKTRKAKVNTTPKSHEVFLKSDPNRSGLALLIPVLSAHNKVTAAVVTFEDVVCQQCRHLLAVIPHGMQD